MIKEEKLIVELIAIWQLRNIHVDFRFRSTNTESEVQWKETGREYQRQCKQPHRMD